MMMITCTYNAYKTEQDITNVSETESHIQHIAAKLGTLCCAIRNLSYALDINSL